MINFTINCRIKEITMKSIDWWNDCPEEMLKLENERFKKIYILK